MRRIELLRESLRQVLRNRLRAVLCAAGVAIACGAMTAMVAFAIGLHHEIERPFRELGLLHDVRVQPRLADTGNDDEDEQPPDDPEAERGPGPPLDDDAIARMAGLDGVETAFPGYRLSNLRVRSGERERTARALGMPRGTAWLSMLQGVLVAGRGLAAGTAAEALVTEQLVRSLELGETGEQALGKRLVLAAQGLTEGDRQAHGTSYHLQQRELEVEVVGVLRPPGIASNIAGRALMLPVDLMRDLPGSSLESILRRRQSAAYLDLSGHGEAIVRVHRIADVPAVVERIEAMGYRATSPLQQLQRVQAFFALVEFLFAAVGTVALVIACLGILNTLLMSVLERTAEIGVYKALGASSGDVRTLFLGEAVVLGLAGAVAGLALAWVVTGVMSVAVDWYAESQGLGATVVAFRFPPWLVLGSIAFTVGMTLLGGLYPASRAARIEPISALRSE